MGELEYVSASYVVRNGTIVSKHIFAGNGRVASTVGNVTDTGTTTTNNVLYYHPDHLGSSSYVTDKQGRFYEAIEYLPYGETLYNERTESDGVSYKYTGLEKDLETGLYAMTHRYYDASIGKFLSVDPILEMYIEGEGNGGVYNSINLGLYSYASCNPINFSDPSGLLSGKDLDSAGIGSWRGFEIDEVESSKTAFTKRHPGSPNTKTLKSGRVLADLPQDIKISEGTFKPNRYQWPSLKNIYTGASNFVDKYHYEKNPDEVHRLDLDRAWNPKQIWYGPNASFRVDAVAVGVPGAGSFIDITVLNQDGKQNRRLRLMHFVEINKSIYSGKGKTFAPGTYIGKTTELIGFNTGPHLHIEAIGNRYDFGFMKIPYNRSDIQSWMGGR